MLLAAGLAVLLYLAGQRSMRGGEGPPAGAADAVTAATATQAPPPTPAAASPAPPADALAAAAPAAAVAVEAPPQALPPPPAQPSSAQRPSAPTRREPQAPEVRIVTADPEPAATSPPAPRTYVRQIELPDSRIVELGGIAWSEQRPFALINGRVVGPGDVVESLEVVRIEPRQVELRGDGERYLLRLK